MLKERERNEEEQEGKRDVLYVQVPCQNPLSFFWWLVSDDVEYCQIIEIYFLLQKGR